MKTTKTQLKVVRAAGSNPAARTTSDPQPVDVTTSTDSSPPSSSGEASEKRPQSVPFSQSDWFAEQGGKVRGKHYIKANGYAAPPGTGPAGEKCQTCKHARVIETAGRYWKCRLMEHIWMHSRRTDILARSPACSKWEGKA